MRSATFHPAAAAAPVLALLVLALLVLTGCSSATDGGPTTPLSSLSAADVHFFTQDEVPEVVPDALFEGRVLLDDAGCLRLDGPDAHTVIWPKGYSLAVAEGALAVRDGGGETVGRIGGAFRLGGGEVPFLHDGIPMAKVDREAAEAACPGRFWIVAENR